MLVPLLEELLLEVPLDITEDDTLELVFDELDTDVPLLEELELLLELLRLLEVFELLADELLEPLEVPVDVPLEPLEVPLDKLEVPLEPLEVPLELELLLKAGIQQHKLPSTHASNPLPP
ncbi:MAG: hypothetical protein V1875_00010 [Candidatus Altiarchaeota archaeon]